MFALYGLLLVNTNVDDSRNSVGRNAWWVMTTVVARADQAIFWKSTMYPGVMGST